MATDNIEPTIPDWRTVPVAEDTEMPVLDKGHGRCVSCTCTGSDVVEDESPALPTSFGAELEVKYEDGWTGTLMTRFAPVLFFGFLPIYASDGTYCRLSDKGLLALLGKRAAELDPMKDGETYQVPSESESASILELYDIPTVLIKPEREGIKEAWNARWKRTGRSVKCVDGGWYIESLLDRFPDVESLKAVRFTNGVFEEIPGHAPMHDGVSLFLPDEVPNRKAN